MSRLDAVTYIELPSNADARGTLTSVEGGADIPFEIQRVFWMHHIVSERGGHAHVDTDQIIIAMSGHFSVDLSDGTHALTFSLNDPTLGIYTPRMVFVRLYDFSPDAVCLVLANTHYDMSKSIRSWAEYVQRMTT